MNIHSEIEWTVYPDSGKTMTPDQARIALAHERSVFGSSITQVTPAGVTRVLIGGQWYQVSAGAENADPVAE